VNADIDASADIDSTKIDLSSSGYLTSGQTTANITGTWNFAGQTNIDALIASIATIGTLNAANMIAANATITALDADTLNISSLASIAYLQSDYADITSLATLANFDVVNINGGSPGSLSNVIFNWNSGGENIHTGGAATMGYFTSTNITDQTNTGSIYTFIRGFNTTYRTYLTSKFTKISGISTISIYARIWDSAGTAYCKVDVGGANNEVSVSTTSPTWATKTDIDVSGLTNGTTYDITIQLKNGLNAWVFFNSIILIGS